MFQLKSFPELLWCELFRPLMGLCLLLVFYSINPKPCSGLVLFLLTLKLWNLQTHRSHSLIITHTLTICLFSFLLIWQMECESWSLFLSWFDCRTSSYSLWFINGHVGHVLLLLLVSEILQFASETWPVLPNTIIISIASHFT